MPNFVKVEYFQIDFRYLVVIAATLSAFLGSSTSAHIQEEQTFPSEGAAIEARIASYPKGDSVRDFEWFQPLETVEGSDAFELQRLPSPALAKSELFQPAVDYAARTESNALIVWHGGAVRYETYGPGYTASDRTWSQSMHKSVVALLIGTAIDRGYIASVDEEASRYLTEWRCSDRAGITIRQLLTMTSGLQNDGNSPIGLPFGLRLGFSNDIERAALDAMLTHKPGTAFQYNNANPQILLAVLERATGKRYAEILQEWLWAPIGSDPALLWLDRSGGAAHGANSLGAAPVDWLRLGLLILGEGRVDGKQVVSKEYLDAATRPSTANPNYGFLTWLGSPTGNSRSFGLNTTFSVTHSAPFLASDMIYFDGVGGQRVYVSQAENVVIVRVGGTTMDWDDAIIPNAVVAALHEAQIEPTSDRSLEEDQQ